MLITTRKFIIRYETRNGMATKLLPQSPRLVGKEFFLVGSQYGGSSLVRPLKTPLLCLCLILFFFNFKQYDKKNLFYHPALVHKGNNVIMPR